MLHADIPEERATWLSLWQLSPKKEPFSHPSYAECFTSNGEAAACAVMTGDGFAVMMPLILRPLSNGMQDATTPYGYGGAFAWGEVDADEFWDAMDAWARQYKVVSLFARLSLFSETILPFRGETAHHIDNVVRTLELDDSAMWTDYDHKVRKNVNKAGRSGVTVEWDLDGSRLAEFHEIYFLTMTRRGASAGYYFPIEFFEKLIADCPDGIAFAHAFLDGKMISSELVLVGTDHTYSFLGGTLDAYFNYRPNDLLKHEIIRWSRAQGKRAFVLGGGLSPDCGIYRYKLSFAPRDGSRPFLVGQRIYDDAAYEALVEARKRTEPEWSPRAGFFPAYRAPRATPPIEESEVEPVKKPFQGAYLK